MLSLISMYVVAWFEANASLISMHVIAWFDANASLISMHVACCLLIVRHLTVPMSDDIGTTTLKVVCSVSDS
jgi:hypothetical protein